MYPKNLVVDVRDDSYGKIEQFEQLIGKNVKVEFEINASTYTKDGIERWFNNVRAYRIKDIAQEQAKEAERAEQQQSDDPFAQAANDLPY